MQVEWYGQSAFRLAAGDRTVVVDPFGDISGLAAQGITFDYPPIDGVTADLVLVTHEHADHNAVEVVQGDPVVVRATAGTHDSPIGTVIAIASEHDPVGGTQRGANTILVFELDGIRTAHFGDFGQGALRDEQAAAIGRIDLLFLPVGGGPTIDAEQAAAIVERLDPAWVIPMHYRTPRISFLEDAEAFLGRMANVRRLDASAFDTASLAPDDGRPLVVVPQAP
jgi:L-ascorbate metabolism protein UlaG (beta-lactamase superfamily)